MALSEDLPLYRDTYRLLNNLLVLTQDFPRFFRYSMGSRMVDLTLDMLSLIYKANSSYEKVGVLAEFLDRYRMLQMLFRVCVEQKAKTDSRNGCLTRILAYEKNISLQHKNVFMHLVLMAVIINMTAILFHERV